MKLERAAMKPALLTGPDGLDARYSYFYRNSGVPCLPDGQRRDIADRGWVSSRRGILTDRTHNRLLWQAGDLLRQGIDVVFDFGQPVAVDRVALDAQMPADLVYTLGEVSLWTAWSRMDRFDLVARHTDCSSRPIVLEPVGRVARYVKLHVRPMQQGPLLLTGVDIFGSILETVPIDPAQWAIYPLPQKLTFSRGQFRLPRAALQVGPTVPAADHLRQFYTQQIQLPGSFGHPIELRRRRMPAEHYRLRIEPRRIRVEAGDTQGFVWALQSLLCLRGAHGDSLPCLEVRDGPASRLRGVHLYLPGEENLEFAKRFLDEVVLRAKLNTLFVELGGGMEFKRHPEINQGWAEFCRRQVELRGEWPEGVGESAYRTTRNSLHVELAGGRWLRQEQVRQFVQFARSRGLEVIPEVQSLSHGYWLLQRHRDLAEYPLATFPFTYCPSNPKTYELLFDCLDEVIDVFQPRRIHIGHDEIYELAQCARCRDRRGADLLAEDIKRIHAHLQRRGIRIMMWGDSLIKKHNGLEKRRLQLWEKYHRDTVSTYQAIDLIPKDVAILNWSWSIDPDGKRYLMEHGLAHLYGNLHALRFPDWPAPRSDRLDLGGEVSTWTGLSRDELGFDGLFHRILLAGQVLWGPWRQDELPLHERVVTERVGHLKSTFAGSAPARRPGFKAIPLPQRNRIKLPGELPFGPAHACGRVRFKPDFERPVRLGPGQQAVLGSNIRASAVHLLLACQEPETYHTTADTYGQPVSVELGRLVVQFADGQELEEPLLYGVHVASLWSHPLLGGPWCYRAEPAYRGARSILYSTGLNWSSRRPIRRIVLHGTRQPLDNPLLLFAVTLAP